VHVSESFKTFASGIKDVRDAKKFQAEDFASLPDILNIPMRLSPLRLSHGIG
jgi:hypothetical protein